MSFFSKKPEEQLELLKKWHFEELKSAYDIATLTESYANKIYRLASKLRI